jgi:serine/threonine-protein kinase
MQNIGRYVLHDMIARGGMGTVHIGRLVAEGNFARTVAIKRLHPEYAKVPEFVSMFVDEARLAGRIRNPNVVPVIDVVSTEGELLLVMEYVAGETLARLLSRLRKTEARVPPEIAVAIVCDLLDGLHAAHETKDERGEPLDIVHRDVSPQNVIVGVDGVARVLDFGVAKAAGRMHETREGEIKGKLSYMAPEQLEQETSRASDVFAASVVLWETLVGRRLFQGETEGQTVRILACDVEPPSRAAGVPEAFDAVVLQGLAKKPEDRFATARDMSIALARCAPRADRHVIADWVRSLAKDALVAREEIISRIESSPFSRPTATPAKAEPAKTSDAIIVPKSVLAIIAGALAIVLVAVLVESAVSTHAEPPAVQAPAPKPTVTTEVVYVNAPQPTTTATATATTASATAAASPRGATTVYVERPTPLTDPVATHVARSSGGGSVFSQAQSLSMSGDKSGARALLEPRVFGSGHASTDEVNLLRTICKAQHDRSCTASIGARYP